MSRRAVANEKWVRKVWARFVRRSLGATKDLLLRCSAAGLFFVESLELEKLPIFARKLEWLFAKYVPIDTKIMADIGCGRGEGRVG